MAKIHRRSGKDLERMREACRTAAEILQLTAKEIKPGVTTKDVEDAARQFMAERSCKSVFYKYRGFPGYICISLNDEVVHGIASSKRRIQYGDIVKIDVGIVKNGWVGDNAMTVPVGEIDPRTRHLLWATEEALETAIGFAREGNRLEDICSSVERIVRQWKYTVVREFVGHGVGKKLHEDPQIPNFGVPGTGPLLKSGMIFALEPMVNLGTERVKIQKDNWTVNTLDGLPSAHYEHSVLITKGDPEILTPRPRLIPATMPPVGLGMGGSVEK
ncbi:MAG: methionyl aminopeptidase [Verrucomicrobiales bacterium]|jgi:methionyl aminopeptidase